MRPFLLLPLAASLLACSGTRAPAGRTPVAATTSDIAFVGATLVDPRVSTSTPDAIIVISNGRIACAGARSACRVSIGARIVDLAGKFVTAGLVDAHVHFSQTGWVDARPDAIDLRSELAYDSTVAALQQNPAPFDRAWLCSGVTAVFDVGGFPFTMPMARAHEANPMAPRMAAAGPLLTSRAHWLNLPFIQQFVPMSSDSLIRSAVSGIARMGSSAIKVWYLQVPEAERAHAKAMLMVAGAESKRVGKPLIVHATQLPRAKEALEAGAKVLVHSVETAEIDDEFITAAKRNGTVVIPTLTVMEGYGDVGLGRSPAHRYPLECVDGVTRAKLERSLPEPLRSPLAVVVTPGSLWVRQRATMEVNLRKMRDAGIPIAMGTDAGNPGTAHGPSIYREMEAMQAAGMTAREVLLSSTLIAARAMGREPDLGSIDAGKLGDLTIFNADPGANIFNARQVHGVVRGGVYHERAQLLPAAR
jgi:imidazolonepropionase-like amidohydrolase